MNGQGKPWILKHRLLDLTHVLRRPVEIAALTGHESVFIAVRVAEGHDLNFICSYYSYQTSISYPSGSSMYIYG